MRFLVLLMFFGSAVWCMPNANPVAKEESPLDPIYSVVQQCVGETTLLCLKEKALRYVESLTPSGRSQLIDGVTIIREGSARSSRSLDPLPLEATSREIEVESRLIDNIIDFLEHASVQISLPTGHAEEAKRSMEAESARGKGSRKKLRRLMPLIKFLELKAKALSAIFLGVITFVAAKLLLLLKLVVIAKLFAAVKSLISSKSHETYEIVQSKPEIHSHHESQGYGGSSWGRLSEEPHDLAYSAYTNKKV